jgi:hypothetical protein
LTWDKGRPGPSIAAAQVEARTAENEAVVVRAERTLSALHRYRFMLADSDNIARHAQAVIHLMADPTPEALTHAQRHLRAAHRLHRTADELAQLEAAPTPKHPNDERLLAQLLRTARNQLELATTHSANVLAGMRPKARKTPNDDGPFEGAPPRINVSNWPDPARSAISGVRQL